MAKIKRKETLSDKISSVLNAAPSTFDPEDEVDDTSAKVTNFESEESDIDDALLSNFRKQNVDLLGDVDNRYAGKKGSRKSLESESDDDLDSDFEEDRRNALDKQVSSSSEENEVQDTESNSSVWEEARSTSESDEQTSDSDEQTDASHSDNSSVYEGDNVSGSDFENGKSDFKHLGATDVSLQVKKGFSVRNQMSIWENLLEIRIQLQKCLLTANKMPNKKYYNEIKNNSENKLTDKINETKQTLTSVLDKLLFLQSTVIKNYPETNKFLNNKMEVIDEDNEEIPSDTDDEMEPEKESNSDQDVAETPKKKRKLNDYEREISNIHSKYSEYRNSVIEKWNAKTRLSIIKNKGQTHSVINQIEHALKDRNKLVKRTQLKRTEYQTLGEEDNNKQPQEDQQMGKIEEYNKEIFDDTDFYQQLLRELIEVKAADITDPIQLGKQWTYLQNLRSKMKRKIDTRATKGRKIRYTVHTKLVNFMAPIDNILWTDEAKSELYSSLFGKKST